MPIPLKSGRGSGVVHDRNRLRAFHSGLIVLTTTDGHDAAEFVGRGLYRLHDTPRSQPISRPERTVAAFPPHRSGSGWPCMGNNHLSTRRKLAIAFAGLVASIIGAGLGAFLGNERPISGGRVSAGTMAVIAVRGLAQFFLEALWFGY